MNNGLARADGKYAWNVDVSVLTSIHERKVVKITVFSDDRADAIRAACKLAQQYGYTDPTVNHITRI